MDILRNLFGNLTSGIIRLLVTVGILAAVYFLLVKPVLHTTDNAINSANKTFEKSFGNGGANITDVNRTLREVNRRVQREIRQAFKATPAHSANKLVNCIQHANGNVHRIEHCAKRY
jgi:predicted PurR-regulated permease PerM